MATINAQDVKRLREATGAPMLDCKKALEEAGGDYDRATQILREKGAAAGAKKAGRATKEGIAKVVVSEDGHTAAAIVVECETDFVSRNEDFKSLVDQLVRGFLAAGKAGEDVEIGGTTVKQHLEDAVGRIRENIQLRAAEFFNAGDAKIAAYNHHDGKWASLVVYTGEGGAAAAHAATQVVAYKPTYLKREDVPQSIVDAEMEIETKRAIEEGKPQEVAVNVARGRVNKEFFQAQVLLEQLIYLDNKTKVSDYLQQNGGAELTAFSLFAVGLTGSEE
ncbi:translation elongation factor Ts [Kamptonema cortianum]|nr:translation elongation factor Ts [Geitlerinema splendidum]MDK3158832.1 translation elongation factor Ts [Kamptonema cortianum]